MAHKKNITTSASPVYRLYSVTALPSKTYTTANTDAIFLNVQSFKFHSKQFCTCFMVVVLIHNSAL